jgi:hypothetical protein
VNIILRNESYSSDVLRELLMKLVDSSHRYGNPALGRRSLRYLHAYENTNSREWQPRIEALIRLADWDLLYSNSGNQNEAALAIYRQAYRLLDEHGIAGESIRGIFSPEMPVVLPDFVASPLISQASSTSTAYIDVEFVIGVDGKSDNIEILDTTRNATRAAEKELIRLVRHRAFGLARSDRADSDNRFAGYARPVHYACACLVRVPEQPLSDV